MNKNNENNNILQDAFESELENEQKNQYKDTRSYPQSNNENQKQYSESNDASKKFAFDSLESIRKRLLDLTGRNSLLNFRHPKSSCIRFIDELPDQIYTVLQDGC